MAAQRSINLLRSQNVLSPLWQRIESQLGMWSMIALIATLAIGLGTGVIFTVLELQYRSLSTSKSALQTSVDGQKTKELMLHYVKHRLGIIDKIRPTQFAWNTVLDVATGIAVPPTLTSLTIDDKKRVVVTVTLPSLDDAVSVVSGVAQLVADKKIRGPQITSLQLNQDGTTQMSISFSPVFNLLL